MKLHRTKKGFTLIELLVVITIIGILATGATATYTSQIQKARDSTRITDMNALRGALEQAYADMTEYPRNVNKISNNAECTPGSLDDTTSIGCVIKLGYLDKLPTDPKAKQSSSGSTLYYSYYGFDNDGVDYQVYEISTGIESTGMRDTKAIQDGGNDNERIEFGNVGLNAFTNYSTTTQTFEKCAPITTTNNTLTAGGSAKNPIAVGGGDCSTN